MKENNTAEENTAKNAAPEAAAKEPPPASDPLQEMTDLLKRTQANFENYRKQMEKRMEELREMAAKDIILEIIPILDHFELALKNTANHHYFVQGIELIYAQLTSLLEKNDVTIMETNGKRFDPHAHEALLKVESAEPENTILEEFQKGFLLHGRVIRHAKVKLSAGKKFTSGKVDAAENIPGIEKMKTHTFAVKENKDNDEGGN